MDTEAIQELVDGFIDQLREELIKLSKNLTANTEAAVEEARILGLSQEEAPYLVFDLANPIESVEASRQRCRAHAEHIFDMCDAMDPEEEVFACAMILERLSELHLEIDSLFSPADG